MALPVNGSTHLIPAYYSIYRPRKDERLSWPSWLTYSGWFTHISGHPSATGRAQDRESSPARNRRSTTVPLLLTRYSVYSVKYRQSNVHLILLWLIKRLAIVVIHLSSLEFVFTFVTDSCHLPAAQKLAITHPGSIVHTSCQQQYTSLIMSLPEARSMTAVIVASCHYNSCCMSYGRFCASLLYFSRTVHLWIRYEMLF